MKLVSLLACVAVLSAPAMAATSPDPVVAQFNLAKTAIAETYKADVKACNEKPKLEQKACLSESQKKRQAALKDAGKQRDANLKCMTCGAVTEVTTAEVKGEGSGVGAAVGAVAGGAVANQLSKDKGSNKALTIAGAVGGGLLGNAIEKQGKTKTEWTVAVKLRNGKTETVKTQQDPQVKAGDFVKVEDGQLLKP